MFVGFGVQGVDQCVDANLCPLVSMLFALSPLLLPRNEYHVNSTKLVLSTCIRVFRPVNGMLQPRICINSTQLRHLHLNPSYAYLYAAIQTSVLRLTLKALA